MQFYYSNNNFETKNYKIKLELWIDNFETWKALTVRGERASLVGSLLGEGLILVRIKMANPFLFIIIITIIITYK